MDECKPLAGGVNHGKAVQVDPIKPRLKPPGSKRLKLNCDALLSTSAFKFTLRRYTMVLETGEELREVSDAVELVTGRGLHSFTIQLYMSRF